MLSTSFKKTQNKADIWGSGELCPNDTWMSKDAEKHTSILDYPNTS